MGWRSGVQTGGGKGKGVDGMGGGGGGGGGGGLLLRGGRRGG